MSTFAVGVIEGFYGREWEWAARESYAEFLESIAFDFYIYAPKGDPFLRKRWREPWPETSLEHLSRMGSAYRDRGVQWGVGLSPFEIYLSYDGSAKAALLEKVASINELNPDILCVLLDDMKGDITNLANTQADIFETIANASTARRIILCPTYYSTDPILEKVFGKMPDRYWEVLGKRIDPSVDIFWTGPKVCSTEYPEDHLTEVANRLGRKPFLWDNHPVNDSESRSKRLYLSAYENRPHTLSDHCAGHAVNPMNQAWLTRIPLWTLKKSYNAGEAYDPKLAFKASVTAQCEPELAQLILEDVAEFEGEGLEGLDDGRRQEMIVKYSAFESPYSSEIVDWLEGGYAFDPACLTE